MNKNWRTRDDLVVQVLNLQAQIRNMRRRLKYIRNSVDYLIQTPYAETNTISPKSRKKRGRGD